jgi:hypothetical protein
LTWKVTSWRSDGEVRTRVEQILAVIHQNAAPLLIAIATLMAGGILAVVALHLITE